MSANRIKYTGLAELYEGLRNLPKELHAESADIVYANADKAAQEIIAAYPKRTGNLARGVRVKREPGQFGARAAVRNTAPHAFMFENGTQARHTAIGANRGSMPAGHVFVPIVVRRRRIMYAVLRELLIKHGLIVTGEAA